MEDVPAPLAGPGQVLIKTSKSLVSLGTERMLVEFGKAGLVAKARQQPDKVKAVLDKMKTDGIFPTLEAVFKKLNQPLPLGYCNVGQVIQVGAGVKSVALGDRVASNGNHAEVVAVPENLVAKVPDEVTDNQAVFTVIGAIGLQGIRLIAPTFGETIVVQGLGLIGLLAAQLLRANGCHVIGIDFDQSKINLANKLGIEAINITNGTDPVKYVTDKTSGIGADGVLITASSKSNEIISQAARMSRKKGRIVLVGVVGLDISREDFYEKELNFQVSCSYGPGRYDDQYEQRGIDYPINYVRWTEQRNFQAVLKALANKQLSVDPLITEEFKLDEYEKIYSNLNRGNIASLLVYDTHQEHSNLIHVNKKVVDPVKGAVGIIGAGNFVNAMILPSLRSNNIPVQVIASSGGLNGKILARKNAIPKATSNYQDILEDKDVDLVLIATRHNSHAQMTIEALEAGKHVFVEKPLALSLEELENIDQCHIKSVKTLVVGFNRRFSPHTAHVKKYLTESTPINLNFTMNAGHIPIDHWVHSPDIGGGRLVGEACHYLDLMVFLTGEKIKSIIVNSLGQHTDIKTDNASILVELERGSQGVINYFANGSKSYPKERIEVFNQGHTFVIDNFRKTSIFGVKGARGLRTAINKGHKEQFRRLYQFLVDGGEPIIPYEEIMNVSKATLAIPESIKSNNRVEVY